MNASEHYLDALREALPRSQRRRIVAEIRNHLADDVAAEVARGVDPAEAERLTIERLGPPDQLASQFAARRRRVSTPVFAALAATGLVVVVGAAFSLSHTRHASPAPSTARTAATDRVFRYPAIPISVARQQAAIASQLSALRITVIQRNGSEVAVVPVVVPRPR